MVNKLSVCVWVCVGTLCTLYPDRVLCPTSANRLLCPLGRLGTHIITNDFFRRAVVVVLDKWIPG